MQTVICQKCKQPISVPEGKDFIVCCNEVIMVITERDAQIFFDKLINSPKPNKALKNAAHNKNDTTP